MLNRSETKQLVKLLKKIENPHEGLPKPVFDVLVKMVPFIACELIIANSKGQLLLTWRHDKFWKGWHFPGGLMRYNDLFDERIQRTAEAELGIDIESSKFLFPINYTRTRRGHAVSLVFLCKTEMKPKSGKFFSAMPKNIIEVHKEVWNRVKKLA
jgi:ADP-ribose pyrophosphatase YjhB (NUDIX family)